MGGSTGGGHVHSSATCQETYCAGTHDYFRGGIEWIFFPTIFVCSTVSQLCSSAQSIVCSISPFASIALNLVREYLLYVISMVILALLDLVQFTFSVGRQQADSSPCLSEVCQDGVQGLWCSCHRLLCWPLCHCHAPCRWASRLAHILHPNTPYPIPHTHVPVPFLVLFLVPFPFLKHCLHEMARSPSLYYMHHVRWCCFFFDGQYDSCLMLHLYLSDSSLCSWSAVWESPYDRASSAESFEAALSLCRAQCQQSVPWVPLPCPHCFQKGKSVAH